MKYEQLNRNIIDLVGGKSNIKAVAHCVTRLRLTLNDRNKAWTEKIKELDGVIDVVSSEIAYQIIIGTHVTDVYNEFMEIIDGVTGDGNEESAKLTVKGILQSALAVITESMSSIVDVLLAAGILASILAILSMTGLVSAESPTYLIFDAIRSSTFHFLPVLLAFSSARRLKVNPYVAVVLAFTLLSSTIDGAEGLSLFGISLPAITYASTFIPILLGVAFLGYITKVLTKILPKAVHFFLIPVASLMIALPVTLLLFGPIGIWISGALTGICNFLMNTLGNWSVVALYAAFQPFLIVCGAGNFMVPLVLNFFAAMGYDPIFLAAATISDIAVSGAMIGYFLRTKDKKQKQLFGTVGFSALMGVTEPAIFGVFVKYRRPFIAVMIGGGLGGLTAGFLQVKTYALAWGLAGLPTYLAGGSMSNFIFMLISVAIGFVGALVAAYMLGVPGDNKEKQNQEESKAHRTDEKSLKQLKVGKVTEGKLISLADVADKAFSSGAMGKGIGIIPDGAKANVIAPVSGILTVVFPTKHAYGIKTDEGLEVLIHIGIDTVNLEGKFFDCKVALGQRIEQGALLAVVDFPGMTGAGFDATTIVIITNTESYLDVIPVKDLESNTMLSVII